MLLVYAYVQRHTGDVRPCPKCGGERWSITINVEDKLNVYDELSATITNKQGDLVAERIQKTDLNTSASLSADSGKPSKISVQRKVRVRGFEEEGSAAAALATSFNKLRKTNYHVEQKTEEDSDYADRVFISGSDNPKRLNVQIRHLDIEMIARVGKRGAFDGDRTAADMVATIRDAIDDKANVDSKVKADTILQLMVLAPLGEGIRHAIEDSVVDFKGFREIWLSPFHEESFPLTPT